jgi:hypothetical protein
MRAPSTLWLRPADSTTASAAWTRRPPTEGPSRNRVRYIFVPFAFFHNRPKLSNLFAYNLLLNKRLSI